MERKMNINDLSTQLLYTTVPVWIENADGSKATATGFIISKSREGVIPFLVTNKHVTQNAKKIIIRMASMESEQPCKNNKGINIELDPAHFQYDENFDISGMPIGPIVNDLQQEGKFVFFRTLSDEIIPSQEEINKLSAIEDIIFIGYPNGLYDMENLSPLIRQGITATPIWNDFQKQPNFLIDAGVFPGSSGSPVFLFNRGSYSSGGNIVIGNRIMFLGVLTGAFIRQENNSRAYLNLGHVIKSNIVKKFLDSLLGTI